MHVVVFSDDDGGCLADLPILITDDKELADALVVCWGGIAKNEVKVEWE